MNIHDKFSTILKTNKLGIKSIHGLEKYCKVGIGSVSKFLNADEEPSLGTIKKIQEVLSINTEWWETGKGDIYLRNGTHDYNQSDNKQKQLMTPRETFYIDLIEKNEEYNLIPRAVLKDYKIVPDKIIDVIIQSNENEKKALIEGLNSKYELIIQGYKNKVADLENELNRLRGG